MHSVSWSISYLWHRILCRLEDQLGEVVVSAWLDHTEAVSFQENMLVLKEVSEFRREMISQRVLPLIRLIVKEEFDFDIEIVIGEK